MTTDAETDVKPGPCQACDGLGGSQGEGGRRVWCGPCDGTGTEGGLPWGLRTQLTPEELADAERWVEAVKSGSEWYQANR